MTEDDTNKNSLLTTISRIAITRPDDVAIIHNSQNITSDTISYALLAHQCNILNQELQRLLSTRHQIVATALPVSLHLVVALISIIFPKRTYVPLQTPVNDITLRNAQSANVSCIVTDQHNIKSLLYGLQRQSIEHTTHLLVINSILSYHIVVIQQPVSIVNVQWAYIVQTSGTTRDGYGLQVQVPVSSFNAHLEEMRIALDIKDRSNKLDVNQSQVFTFVTPPTFDPHIIGHTVRVLSDVNVLPEWLTESIALTNTCVNKAITILSTTPSRLFLMLSTDIIRSILAGETSLNHLILGGESFPFNRLDAILPCEQWSSSVRISNIYGTTECSVWASLYTIIPNFATIYRLFGIPIGNPFVHTLFKLSPDIAVRDKENTEQNLDQPTKVEQEHNLFYLEIGGPDRVTCTGNEKELCILRDTGDVIEDLTKAVHFEISCNSIYYSSSKIVDKWLVCRGRRDYQIKRFGCRVQLDQISVACISLSQLVKDSIAIFDNQRNTLALIIIPAPSEQSVSTSYLQEQVLKHVQLQLPRHCVPDMIVCYKTHRFPVTDNGKIHRVKISQWLQDYLTIHDQILLKATRPSFNILQQFLPDIQLEQYFAASGGDSLLAVQVVNQILLLVSNDSKESARVNLFQTLMGSKITEFIDIAEQWLQPTFSDLLTVSHKRSHSDSHVSTEEKRICLHTPESINGHNDAFIIGRGWTGNVNDLPVMVFGKENKSNVVFKHRLDKCIDASAVFMFNGYQKDQDENGYIFIGSHSGQLVCINLSGELVWIVKLDSRIESSATISHCKRYIYVGTYGGTLYALDPLTGDILAQVTIIGEIKSSPAVDDSERIWFGSHNGHLYVLQWYQTSSDQKLSLNICAQLNLFKPVYGKVTFDIEHQEAYIPCTSGILYVMSMRDLTILRKSSFDIPIFAQPALLQDGSVIVAHMKGLSCVNRSLETMWEYTSHAPIFSSPVVIIVNEREMVVCGSHTREILLLNTKEGKKLWSMSTDREVFATCSIAYNAVKQTLCIIYAVASGHIGRVDLLIGADGTVKSVNENTVIVKGKVFSSPTLIAYTSEGNHLSVVVGSRDNYCYCLVL